MVLTTSFHIGKKETLELLPKSFPLDSKSKRRILKCQIHLRNLLKSFSFWDLDPIKYTYSSGNCHLGPLPRPFPCRSWYSMKHHKTLANATTFGKHRRTTRREKFLAEMEQVVPWKLLCSLIEPFYPKPGKGRPPIGLERMLRIHFLQSWLNLSDPAAEEVLYDIESMRRFVGIDLGNEPVPDETTICKFRHLLEANSLGERIFKEINTHLESNGMRLSEGTIMDATQKQ